MSRLQCRGSIAGVAVVVALLSSRSADAQFVVDPGPPPGGSWNALTSGVHNELVNQALAEHRLEKIQERLSRGAGQGDPGAVDHDLRRIDKLKYRIAVDEWLIRKMFLQDPGIYPYPIRLDPISCAALADVRRPPQFPYPSWPVPAPPPPASTATIPITIINSALPGPGLAFAIDGVAHQSAGGSRQELAVAPGSTITYDAGGSIGPRRYRMSPGQYEFRVSAEGWALYKLPATP